MRNVLRLTMITISLGIAEWSLADDPLPDPRGLLTGVEQDRLAIASGRMKFEVTSSSARSPDETARARMEGQPFALLGVNSDETPSVAKATREEESMTWPSWWSGEDRTAIAGRWGVRFLPTVYILDAKGVIRFKNLRGEALEKAVDSLVEEAGR